VGSHPLAVIGTYRAEEIHPGHPLYEILPHLQRDRSIEHLRLAELTLDATAQLVEAGYGPCSPELAAYLHARSDGNPFFLIELLRDLAERRMLGRDGTGRLAPPAAAVDVPDLLQHVITQRVTRLGAEVEALLDVAAVMGNEWHLAVVEAALGWPEESLLHALEAALDGKVIVPMAGRTEDYRFAHALIGEVLYGR
jgi:predicted ATPase